MTRIPPNYKWAQSNRSDLLGSLIGTFNVDFSIRLGATRVTRLTAVTLGLDSYPIGFEYLNDGGSDKIFTVAGVNVYNNSGVPNGNFSQDATGPTTCSSSASDIKTFNGALYVTTYDSGGDKLYKKTAGGGWGANGTTLGTTSGTHMLCKYGNKLFISRGNNSIYSMDNSDTITTNALTLDPLYYVTCMRAARNRIWICTLKPKGKAEIFEWDGSAAQPTTSYFLDTAGALACVIKDDVPWIVDTSGRLLQFQGGTFIEKARFPLDEKILAISQNTLNNRFIHPNGMAIINGRINILINNLLGDSAGSIPEYMPAGIWEFDEETGSLYHKSSASYLPVSTDTLTDFGQNRILFAGGLAEAKIENSATNATGDFLAGMTVFTNASASSAGVFTNETLENLTGTYHAHQKCGYLVTTQIMSENVKESWQKIFLRTKQLLSLADKVVLKYRTTELEPVRATITWISTNEFTTTDDLSLVLKGDEVEILQGTGGGLCAHITDIHMTGSSTYYVQIDETATGVTTGTAKARFQRWKKCKAVLNNMKEQAKEISLEGIISPWIQLKVWMLFTGKEELKALDLVNSTNQKSV